MKIIKLFLFAFFITAMIIPLSSIEGIETDEKQCNNPSHVLVERTNKKLACVYERTAEKMGWKIIKPILNINKMGDNTSKEEYNIMIAERLQYQEEKNLESPIGGYPTYEQAQLISQNLTEDLEEAVEEFVTPITESIDDNIDVSEIPSPIVVNDSNENITIEKNEFDFRGGQKSGVKPFPKGTFESVQISPENIDEFVNKFVILVDDEIKKRVDKPTKFGYVTDRGTIRMFSDTSYGKQFNYFGNYTNFTGFEYMANSKGIKSFEEAEIIRNELIKEFGITLDGTELDVYAPWGTGVEIFKYFQIRDGVIVDSNQIRVVFEPGMTFITITNWNDNLSEMNLLDLDTVQQIGIDYAQTFETFTEQPCNIQMEDRPFYPDEITHTKLKMINGTPIYVVYSGTCQISSALMSQDFYTYVNALTGEPLYIERGPSM